MKQPRPVAGARHLLGDRHATDAADRVVRCLGPGGRLARAKDREQALDALRVGGVRALEHDAVARQRRQLGRGVSRVSVGRQGPRAGRFQDHPDDGAIARDAGQLRRQLRRGRGVLAPAGRRRQRRTRRPPGAAPARRRRSRPAPARRCGAGRPSRSAGRRWAPAPAAPRPRPQSRSARAGRERSAGAASVRRPDRPRSAPAATRRWARWRIERLNHPARSPSRAGSRTSAAATTGVRSAG